MMGQGGGRGGGPAPIFSWLPCRLGQYEDPDAYPSRRRPMILVRENQSQHSLASEAQAAVGDGRDPSRPRGRSWRRRGAFYLVLLDYNMPGMSGLSTGFAPDGIANEGKPVAILSCTATRALAGEAIMAAGRRFRAEDPRSRKSMISAAAQSIGPQANLRPILISLQHEEKNQAAAGILTSRGDDVRRASAGAGQQGDRRSRTIFTRRRWKAARQGRFLPPSSTPRNRTQCRNGSPGSRPRLPRPTTGPESRRRPRRLFVVVRVRFRTTHSDSPTVSHRPRISPHAQEDEGNAEGLLPRLEIARSPMSPF